MSSFALFVQRHVAVNEVLKLCLVFIFSKAWKRMCAQDIICFYDFWRGNPSQTYVLEPLCVWVFTHLKFPLWNDIQRIFSLYPGTRTLKNWITFQRNVLIHRMPTGKLWNQALVILSHSKLGIYSKERPPLLEAIIGSFSIDNGNSSENATFRVNSRFSISLKIDVYVLHKGYVTRDDRNDDFYRNTALHHCCDMVATLFHYCNAVLQ